MQFSQITPLDGQRQNLQMTPIRLRIRTYCLKYITFLVLPTKSRSRSRNAIFAITPFDGNCKNRQLLFLLRQSYRSEK